MIRGAPRRYQLEWVLLGTVLLSLGALVGYWLYAEHRQVEDIERDRLQVQARVIDENLGRQIEGVDKALVGIREDLPLWIGETMRAAPSRRLKVLSQVMLGVRTLFIADADGTIVDSSRDELIGWNVSEREYFQVPRERPDPAVLYVSAPYQTRLGVFSINLTRVLTNPHGGFGGVVAATLDPEYLEVLLRSVQYAPDMWTAIAHGDGVVFLYSPPIEGTIGRSLAQPGSLYTRHRDSGERATLMTGVAYATGDQRIMAQRTFTRAGLGMDKPLIIAVSRNVSAMYLPWSREALAYAVLYAVFAVAGIFWLRLLQRRRRSSESAAAEQEKADRLLRHFFDLPFVGMAITSPGTKRWLQVNDCLCAMLGYTREELAKLTWAELTHLEDLGKDVAQFERVLRGESDGYAMDKRFIRKDGAVVFTTLDIKCTRNSDGAVEFIVAMVQDLTERKRQENEYRTVIQASTDGFWVTDATGRILDANESICRMLGYSREELLRLGVQDIEAEDSSAEVAARAREIMRTGGALFSGRHRRKDGAVIDVEISVQYLAALGERFFVFIRDITGRKRAQQALQQSEQRLRAIVDTEPECVKVVDRDGALLEMNAAGLAMLEAESLAEAQRHTLLGFLLPEYRAAFGDLHARVMQGESGTLEFEVVGLKGTRRWLETHAAPMRDAAGEVTMLLGITRDITGRKRAEAERAQLEAQLRESQKMEALGTLAGGVAHDFNNIVTTIMGNAELACQDVGPGHAARVSLEEIRKASRRAKDLVQQILAFGRRQVLEREVIALAPVLEESARLLRSTLPAGVKLSVRCAPDVPAVLADPTQVQQVLLNLCTNAWQAMQGQQKPAAIEVGLEPHLAIEALYQGPERRTRGGRVALRPGRYACVTVRDTGPGMNQATRSRIFEPFFTTKPVGKGTGLGLAVVHGIIQDHGASIAVQSAPGEGASFRIYFPAAEQAAEPAPGEGEDTRPLRRENGETPALPGAGKSILYVDDDEAIVLLMTRVLERQGYRVSGYTDPREALAAVRAQPGKFDLVVTDYNMPHMSGLEVSRALRDIRADLPVALASGYITEELRAQAPTAGVGELIYKPNTVDELCAVVARLAHTLPS